MFNNPLADRLQGADTVLVAGCGGGFDIYCGIPLALRLIEAGKRVVLANYSFTALKHCGCEYLGGALWRIDDNAAELTYFPEKWLLEWLGRRGIELPLYGLAQAGVEPLRKAYEAIYARHGVDLVVLVDGGTDSLLFGDEPGLGTVSEDAASILAADMATSGRAVLMALGFGIDHHSGVAHHSFLENVATLTRQGGYLGRLSLTPGTVEAQALVDLVDYANNRCPVHPGIVGNSIASALRGEFGDYHATGRTAGSELFINALMLDYWGFETAALVRHMVYADVLRPTVTIDEVGFIIERERKTTVVRPRKGLPL